MNRARWMVLVAALVGAGTGCETCGGCGESSETSASEPPEASEGSHRPTPPPRRALPTPTAEQLPLPQDFARFAAHGVTDETYRTELERIEAEIGPVEEAAPLGGGASAPATAAQASEMR